jgi:hypothetical protein
MRLPLVVALALATTAAAQVPDHLQCYKVKDPAARRTYTATLDGLLVQQGCVVKVPAVMVCTDAEKTNVSPTPPGAPPGPTPRTYGCYKLKCARDALPPVALNDQFGSRVVQPMASRLLCAPATPVSTTTSTTMIPQCTSGADCTSNSAGNQCVDGHCGCTAASHCVPGGPGGGGRACLLAGIFLCVTECNTPNVTPCNGGCCSAALNGTCVGGTDDDACGVNGLTCQDCTASALVCSGVCTPPP